MRSSSTARRAGPVTQCVLAGVLADRDVDQRQHRQDQRDAERDDEDRGRACSRAPRASRCRVVAAAQATAGRSSEEHEGDERGEASQTAHGVNLRTDDARQTTIGGHGSTSTPTNDPESPPRLPAPSWRCPTCWRATTSPPFARIAAAGVPRARASRRRCCRCWRRRCGGRASGWSRAAWRWWSTTTRPPTPLAESAAPYLPGAAVAYLPSRGAAYGSGLEPAAHLVGERALALDALARGGLVAVSADALVERDRAARPAAAAGGARARRRAGLRRGRRAAGRGRVRARRHGRGARHASPCGAGSSTCSRPRAASRSGPSSSATRSSACRPSRCSPSARCASSTGRSCIPRPSPATWSRHGAPRRTSR